MAILDEMNLSHPEQYFAPILSAMESLKSIDLHNMPDAEVAISRSVALLKNLAIIGTLNMDETTHGLPSQGSWVRSPPAAPFRRKCGIPLQNPGPDCPHTAPSYKGTVFWTTSSDVPAAFM